MISFRLKRVLRMGAQSLWRHGLRSLLTALGVIFGVASVIAMLAIGEGMRHEALEQIRRLGSDNIIIESVKPPQEDSAPTETQRTAAYGITYRDAERIATTLPGVDIAVPVRTLRRDGAYRMRRMEVMLKATMPWYAEVGRRPVLPGGRFFTTTDLERHAAVCALGYDVARRLFANYDPVGRYIKIESSYYRVIGVMAPVAQSEAASGLTSVNRDVYVPLSTLQDRYGDLIISRSSGSFEAERVELHQLNVRVEKLEDVEATAAAIERVLERFHDARDYAITVPLELLREMERTKRLLNIVLGSIAAISLLVGGIGIMNIMLASVTERTREIGIRRALGAKRRDIVIQFLTETVLLSAGGGMTGIALGMALPWVVTKWFEMETIVTWWSLALSFGISVATGIIFGLYPARRAARMDPIEALRHE